MSKDTSCIPCGDYCYSAANTNAFGIRERTMCPYWGIDPVTEPVTKNSDIWIQTDRERNTYCRFLDMDDKDLGEKRGGFEGLIWDMVKECGVNMKRPNKEDK